ncbi:hypothetical protein [Photorhabdus cinerea]|uniref:Uncharacterized protein n=1 Tax=Photorhabdus cinerea TaxID=471575 RepID=A0A7X5QH18_9GAMM|nr:hypothetical protein [Photorhabdus cinerea]NHB94197.1 hypothetical protein [Photorhabdus cinerea]
MWAAVVIVVLVCGYVYTNSHLPSRFKQNKAIGWNAYFEVARQGGFFLIAGFCLALTLSCLVFAVMMLLNIPVYFGAKYIPFTFAHDLFNSRLVGMSVFSFLILSFTVLISISASYNAEKDFRNPEKRNGIFKEIASNNAIESLLLESIESGLLLLITLKSRKVYVGMVDEARFHHLDTDTIVIIPFMSGYRDKDTLTFCAEHNYADHYRNEGITLTSKPLSVYQFRHVLPLEQIESLSLFNPETYDKFQEVIKDKSN